MQDILLNLVPGAFSPVVHLSQYDKGRVIPFKLVDDKSAYSVPEGAIVKVKATKPSGLGFVVNCTADGDRVTIENTETMSNEFGRFPAELSINAGDVLLGTANFVFNVERSPHPKGTTDGDSDSLIPELTLLVERIENAAESIHDLSVIGTPLTPGQPPMVEYDSENNKINFGLSTANSIVSIALLSTSGTTKTYRITFTNGTHYDFDVTDGEITVEALEEILSDYALQNGYYDELTAGSAEQLLSSQFVEDSVPYKFRTSGGSADIGNREYDEIVGGSIVWNQLAIPRSSGTVEGVNITNNSDGTMTLNGTATAQFAMTAAVRNIQNHVFFMGDALKHFTLFSGYGYNANINGAIIKYIWEANISCYIMGAKGMTFNNDVVKPVLIDLTQMFGPQVADYIYSLEQAQSGKGVAFFKSLFPNDYYPYNAGELLSVEGLQSHDMVEFNVFDNSTFVKGRLDNGVIGSASDTTDLTITSNGVNFTTKVTYRGVVSGKIKIVPNSIYTMMYEAPPNTVGVYLDAYDVNDNWIRRLNATYTSESTGARPILRVPMPSNCDYVRLSIQLASTGSVEVSKICLHLTWSGWRDSEYEPYKKHSYPLDSSLTLRGISKIVDNKFCFDGDIYSYDGKVKRRYIEDNDIGSWDWGLTTWNGTPAFYVRTASATFNFINAATAGNLFLPNYETVSGDAFWTRKDDSKIIAITGNNQIMIRDTSYSTVEALKSALSGTHFVYEKYTPTEETALPYAEIQDVDDFGTEEYISGNLVPVGHNTKYPENLRDKLQHLPNMADSDGVYLIRQTNKQMSLEVFRIPKAPTTDGTYTLKAHVSGGTPSYVWEAEE